MPFEEAAALKPQRVTLSDGKTIDLKLPPGVEDGTQMRLSGKGEAGPGGAGDAIVTIEIRPHRFFTRDGDDVRLDLPIALDEAVQGAPVTVPTVEGAVMLTVPKGSTSGKVLRLKGRGFHRKDGGRGDQLVTLMIDVPADDAELQAFVERLERRRGAQPAGGAGRLAPACRTISPEIARGTGQARRALRARARSRARPGAAAAATPSRSSSGSAIGVYSDGFIHAGNLAYLALLTLFPFFIILAALAQFFGHGAGYGARRSTPSCARVPPIVADLLRKPITDVLAARTGSLLWLGALVGLWTVGSFIETIRDILRRAYGTGYSRAFWHYRLTSAAIIIVSVVLALIAFSAQVLLTAAEQFVYRLLPFAERHGAAGSASAGWRRWRCWSLALYVLFYSLTPSKYRMSDCPKWPGAVFTAVWWMSVTMALPRVLGAARRL